MRKIPRFVLIAAFAAAPLRAQTEAPAAAMLTWIGDASVNLENDLAKQYGEAQRPRLQRGLRQVASLWRTQDGTASAFEEFVRSYFAGDQASLDEMFGRYERLFEMIDGHMNKLRLELRWQSDLDLGPVRPYDSAFAGYSPDAHVNDDFFQNKLAFVVLLNFPLTTLSERAAEGLTWTRRQWAEARLAQRFSKRIPAAVSQEISQAGAEAEKYIAEYNIWMHHLLNEKGRRLFPPKLRLLSHWNLRDQIKAEYSEPKDGLERQRMIQRVMERIVEQTIPSVVINNPHVDWAPYANEVKAAGAADADELAPAGLKISNAPEPDTRYATLLKLFAAESKADPYSPSAPTLLARRFDEDMEIPETRVKAMLEQVLASATVTKVATLISARLGRPLEPFDIWYNGFKARGAYTEEQLDGLVAKKYPTIAAYKKDMPNILAKFGFSVERARFLAENIEVDPARGSGHAWGSGMRSEKPRLRTRIEKGGMNYKSFNIAVHEMGHNIEQIFSLEFIDHTLLQGVPNNAFTEALAMLLQGHDMELLGLAKLDAKARAMNTLSDFWATYEIAGVGLVEIAVWHWMYDHPSATSRELREATLGIAKDVWNRHYAPVFGKKDSVLLGIYSHMIERTLYLPNYPLGHLIGFQVEERMGEMEKIGPEFERAAQYGSVAPDLWMEHADGAPVGPQALLAAAEKAVSVLANPAQ